MAETFGTTEWTKVEKAFWDVWVCQCGNCLSVVVPLTHKPLNP